jgi:RHS repeat-associated protein
LAKRSRPARRDAPTSGGAGDSVDQQFTGKERDQESGLDYFGARYYGSALGRWTSPDDPLIDQDPTNPQSWNLYSYVLNNPLVNTDPTGMSCVALDDGSQADDGDGQGCSGAGVNPSRDGQFDPTRDIQPQQVDVNAQQGSFLDYLSAITFNQIPDQEIDNTGVPPTNQDYIDAIQQRLAQLPNVCDVGINARAGLPGSRFAFGLDANSQKGVRFSGSARIAQLGPVTGSVSYKGPGGTPSATVNVRIPDTPFSVGASTNGQTLTSVNVGARIGRAANFQVYADIGAVGSVRSLKCH